MQNITFVYLKIKGEKASDFAISESVGNYKEIIAAFSENAQLGQPHLMVDGSYDEEIFRNNLILVESFLPAILVYITSKFSGQRIPIAVAGTYLTKVNPLKYERLRDYKFYEAKLKKLLFELLIGMKADKVWNGQCHTQGSCVVIDGGCKKNTIQFTMQIFYRNTCF